VGGEAVGVSRWMAVSARAPSLAQSKPAVSPPTFWAHGCLLWWGADKVPCQLPLPTPYNATGRNPFVTVANEFRVRRPFGPALTLLAICVLINYVDRGNLSIAAPVLSKELGISPKELGILLGAFFWSYTAMQFVSGWLVDRFEVVYVIAAGYFLWTFSTAVTGIVHGFGMLLGMRLLLGIGESVAFPSTSKILANNLPEQERGFANGLLNKERPGTQMLKLADVINMCIGCRK